MRFVITYDIADPKRLRRVARCLERAAVRCQKSVFLFEGTETELATLLALAESFLDLKADVIQSWKLRADQPLLGDVRGAANPVYPGFVVLAPTPPGDPSR